VSFLFWIGAEIAIAACDLAEVIGSAIALNLLFHIPLIWGVCLTSLDVLLILFLQQKGFRLENLLPSFPRVNVLPVVERRVRHGSKFNISIAQIQVERTEPAPGATSQLDGGQPRAAHAVTAGGVIARKPPNNPIKKANASTCVEVIAATNCPAIEFMSTTHFHFSGCTIPPAPDSGALHLPMFFLPRMQ
jgi:hypothetical protein